MPNRKDVLAAPGLRKRQRINGDIVWYWIATEVSSLAKGYVPKTVRMDCDEATARARAAALNADLRRWLRQRNRDKDPAMTRFDGTLGSLLRLYVADEDSPYHELKRNTRRQYDDSLKILRYKLFEVPIETINRKDLMRWFKAFRFPEGEGENRPDYLRRAVHCMKQLRILFRFGASMRYAGCADAAFILHNITFPHPEPRRIAMSFEQAQAIVDKAIELDRRSIALAQALQFELSLRQKDVIGEWFYEPAAEGLTEGGRRWSGGVRWSDIVDGVLTKQTTKTGTLGQWPLAEYPLVATALACFPNEQRVGPMVVSERTGLPYRDFAFQREWRKIANAAGVPAHIWNMDSRAGGITEADEAGAAPEDIRKHATHSSFQTTGRYIRESGKATERVAELRVRHREKGKGDG